MNREKREYYDINSNPTGQFYFKGDPFPDGLFPMVVMICIENSNGEFLMQKRVPEKGGYWGVTGGHPKFGETPLEGMITEAKEELGIDISNKKLEIISEGCDGKHCYKMYYLKADYKPSDFNIQLEELTELKWFSVSELETMTKTGELNENQTACFVKCMNFKNSKNQI